MNKHYSAMAETDSCCRGSPSLGCAVRKTRVESYNDFSDLQRSDLVQL